MNIKRLTSLKTKKIGKKLWTLIDTLMYRTEMENFNDVIIVPKGFITDGASSPWLTWNVCPPMGGNHAEAAVFHDFLYSLDSNHITKKLSSSNEDLEFVFTRKEADELFLKAMLNNKTKKSRAYSIYWAVRIGGSKSWKANMSAFKLKNSY